MGTRISQFTPLTTVASADYFPLVQASDTTNKRVSLASLLASVPLGSAATPSIAFTGDTNTGIFSPGADQVAISTSGSEKLIVLSDGKVGIGTSAPNYQLHATTSFAVGASGFNQQLSFTNDTIQSLLLGTGYTSLKLNPLGGNVGIGTTSPGSPLTIESNAGNQVKVTYPSIASYYLNVTSGGALAINKDGTEYSRWDSSGRLLVGTSTSRSWSGISSQFQIENVGAGTYTSQSIIANSADAVGGLLVLGKSRGTSLGSNTAVQNNDLLGRIYFYGADGSGLVQGATIEALVDGTPGANDMPGRLVFSTTADGASSPTERMRIDSSGRTGFGIAPNAYGDDARITIQGTNVTRSIFSNINGTGSGTHITFGNGNGGVGSITTSGSSTAYNTSSDYRLKENVASVTDGITRLQQLKPSRFNFIVDPDKTVDGFLAHEVQTVVPEAITGEKDAVDDQGNPIYQGIDQSKLVPLLTAALQEAIGRIETLEAEVAALKAQ